MTSYSGEGKKVRGVPNMVLLRLHPTLARWERRPRRPSLNDSQGLAGRDVLLFSTNTGFTFAPYQNHFSLALWLPRHGYLFHAESNWGVPGRSVQIKGTRKYPLHGGAYDGEQNPVEYRKR